MKAARLSGFGQAPEVLQVAEFPPPQPGEGEVLVEMLFAPINPADLNVIEGTYGELPVLPAVIGNEGVGRVVELGSGASSLAIGTLVLPRGGGTWTQYLVAKAEDLTPLPNAVDAAQAAMFTVNPPTAWAMLEDFVTLKPGDWVVQNAANSAVGRCVIQIAKSRGVRTLNVVRRAELVEELKALGGDVVVTEECDLRKEVTALCGGERPILALNAVGGASALNLANAVGDGGYVVTYGAMGRQPVKVPNGLLIFRLLNFTGFWLRRWLNETPLEKQREVVAAIAELSIKGELHLPIHRTYCLNDLQDAVAEAGREARAGKVLLDLQNA